MLKKAVLAKIVDKARDHIIEEYKDETITYVQSDELKVELATKINLKFCIFLKQKLNFLYYQKI